MSPFSSISTQMGPSLLLASLQGQLRSALPTSWLYPVLGGQVLAAQGFAQARSAAQH